MKIHNITKQELINIVKSYTSLEADPKDIDDQVIGTINISMFNMEYEILYNINSDGSVVVRINNDTLMKTYLGSYKNSIDPYNSIASIVRNRIITHDLNHMIYYQEGNRHWKKIKNQIMCSVMKKNISDVRAKNYVDNIITKKITERRYEKYSNAIKAKIWNALGKEKKFPAVIGLIRSKGWIFKGSSIPLQRDVLDILYKLPLSATQRVIDSKIPLKYAHSAMDYLVFILAPQCMDRRLVKAMNNMIGVNKFELWYLLSHDRRHHNADKALEYICVNLQDCKDRYLQAYHLKNADFLLNRHETDYMHIPKVNVKIVRAGILAFKRQTKMKSATAPISVLNLLFRNIHDSVSYEPLTENHYNTYMNMIDKLKRTNSLKKRYELSLDMHRLMNLDSQEYYEHLRASREQDRQNREKTESLPLPNSLKELEKYMLKTGSELIKYGTEYHHCLANYASGLGKKLEYFIKYENAIAQIGCEGTRFKIIQCHGPHDQQNENTAKLNKMLEAILPKVTAAEVAQLQELKRKKALVKSGPRGIRVTGIMPANNGLPF